MKSTIYKELITVEKEEDYSMDLPKGKTCADCVHIKRCELFGFTDSRENDFCDFYPIRFKEKVQ